MIEALRPNGELWRPSQANQRSRCSVCDGDLVSKLVRPKRYAWDHKLPKPCRPRDGWMLKLAKVLHDRLPGGNATDFECGDATISLAGGPTPAYESLLVEHELAVIAANRRPVWIVDGRLVANDWQRGIGPDLPSFLAMAAWSEFAAAWFTRTLSQVFIVVEPADHDVRTGWPTDPERTCYFRVEHLADYEIRRRGGSMVGIDCVFAHGRMFTLDELLRCVRMPKTKPAVHILDDVPWKLVDGEWIRTVRIPS